MISIAIHGGAGNINKINISPEKEIQYRKVLEETINESFKALKNNSTALEAVEIAIRIMEDSPLFNAGKGSVYNAQGKQEMDAAIMCGKTLNSGAVSLVQKVKNPISLAKAVLEKSKHVLLAGEGAIQFAKDNNLEIVADTYFYDKDRFEQWQKIKNSEDIQLDHSSLKDSKFGTVGAVACDAFGNIAAATSTGGMTNKKYGRIGDSPLIGAGTYANNETCAISCTGIGEFYINSVAAYDVSALIEYKNLSLETACNEALDKVYKLGGEGGLIAIDNKGNIAMPFNSKGMFRAFKKFDESHKIEIFNEN